MRTMRVFFAAIIGCFFSCTSPDFTVSKSAIASIEKIYQKEGYSDSAYALISQIAKQIDPHDVSSTLLYFKYVSGYYRCRQDYKTANLYADSMLTMVNAPGNRDKLIKERALANIAKADILYANKQYKDCYYYY